MEFLSTLHTDVKLLLVAAALALLAGLFTGAQKSERRYVALFALLMVVAGFRFHQQQAQDEAARAAEPAHPTVTAAKSKSATQRTGVR